MKIKFYFKILSLTFLLGFASFSWAAQSQETPSTFLTDSLMEMIRSFADDETYEELKLSLWKDYLAYSERYALRFAEVAQENQVSLKELICNTANPSGSAHKIQAFQGKTSGDFDLRKGRDQMEIAKLQELQTTYREICSAKDQGLTLNSRASLMMAETSFYTIYISTRNQLLAFLDLK